jgi:hypothetical protein
MEARSLPKIVKCVSNSETESSNQKTTKYYILLDMCVSNSHFCSPETADSIINSVINLIPNFTIIQLTKPDYKAIYIGDNGFPVYKILRFNPLEKGSGHGRSETWTEVAPGETSNINTPTQNDFHQKPEIIVKVTQEPKKQTTEQKKGGWGNVLEELSQKIGAGDSNQKKNTTKAVGKLEIVKKQKSSFANVIEELSFTLAKMKKPSEEKSSDTN